MNPLRLVLITRRFWPLVGGAEVVMSNLAVALQQAGANVTLLTAAWQPDWPEEFLHRGVRTIRLPNPPVRLWGTLKYMQAVAGWLRTNRDSFDLVYVSMLKHDAYAALSARRKNPFPVVLRTEGAGTAGDVCWQHAARCGGRIRHACQTADAIVAPSQAMQDELIEAGYRSERIHYLPNGVPVPDETTTPARAEARATLAAAHPHLALPSDAPLAVYTGRLITAKGLDDLIDAWSLVAARRPSARLWLVGEGPNRSDFEQRIKERDLSESIVLPGAYDDVDDFLAAGDVFVLPSLEEGMSLALLEAMARGMPVVATNIRANEQLVTHEEHGLLVNTHAPAELAAAIERLFSNAELAARLGSQARARVKEHFSLDQTAERHQALFQRLVASLRSANHASKTPTTNP